jgi:hypothetical protein
MKTFKIDLDMVRQSKGYYLELVEDDYGSSQLEITIQQEGQKYDLTDVTGIEIPFKKPDGHIYVHDLDNGVEIADAAEGKITCTVSTQALDTPGLVYFEVRVMRGLAVSTSVPMRLYVRRPIINDSSITAMDQYPVLQTLIIQCQAITDEEAVRVQQEAERQQNEELRQQGEANRNNAYELAETARDNAYNAKEQERDVNYGQAESARYEAYNAKETERDGKYNQAEATRDEDYGEAENARDNAYNAKELERDGLYADAESARNNAYNNKESERDGLYAAAESQRDDWYRQAEEERDDLYAAAEALRDAKLNIFAMHDATKDRKAPVPMGHYKEVSGYGSIDVPNNAKGQISDVRIKGRSLKNELNYNRDTWEEWILGPNASIVNGCLNINGDGSGNSTLLNTNCKPGTKYGLIFNFPLNTLSGSLRLNADLIGVTTVIYTNGIVGNHKFTFTTQSVLTNNRLGINLSSTTTGYIQIRDIRMFELPAGSEIESDFNTMTAGQLAQKYPYIKGDSTKSTVGAMRIKSVGKNLWTKGEIKTGTDAMPGYGNHGMWGEDNSVILPQISSSLSNRLKLPNIPLKIVMQLVNSSGINFRIYNAKTSETLYSSTTTRNAGVNIINIPALGETDVRIGFGTFNNTNIITNIMIMPADVDESYEPYTESTQYITAKDSEGNIEELRSVPSANDEVNVSTGVRVQRVSEYVLQASDINALDSLTTVDRIRFKKPLDGIGYNTDKLDKWLTLGNYTEKSWKTSDDITNIGCFSLKSSAPEVFLVVAKGKYADLSTARAGLAGTTLTYQLAEPIVTPVEVVGEARVYPGFAVEVTPCAWGYLTQATQTITDAAHPLKAIRAVYRYEYTASGGLRAVDVTADATIEENKTDISLANYDSSKTYFYDVDIDESSTTVGEINAKVEVNNGIVSHDYLAAAADWILTANEAKATMLICTNAGGAARIITPAEIGKINVVQNTSGQNITIKTASGTGVIINNNKTATVIYTGTDYIKISEV